MITNSSPFGFVGQRGFMQERLRVDPIGIREKKKNWKWHGCLWHHRVQNPIWGRISNKSTCKWESFFFSSLVCQGKWKHIFSWLLWFTRNSIGSLKVQIVLRISILEVILTMVSTVMLLLLFLPFCLRRHHCHHLLLIY